MRLKTKIAKLKYPSRKIFVIRLFEMAKVKPDVREKISLLFSDIFMFVRFLFMPHNACVNVSCV